MNELILYENQNTDLTHHGIKGQRWGVRRFQNKDGSLTKAGERRAMRTYNYKRSSAYQNATSRQKATMTNVYNARKQLVGERAANRISYKEQKLGKDGAKETRKEFAKQAALTTATLVTAAVIKNYATLGRAKIQSYAYVNNLAVSSIGYAKGLNEVSGGFTLGINAIQRGKKIVEAMGRR